VSVATTGEVASGRRISAAVSLFAGVLGLAAVVVFPTLALAFGLLAMGAGWLGRRKTGSSSSIAIVGLVLGIVAIVAVVVVVLLFSGGTSGGATAEVGIA